MKEIIFDNRDEALEFIRKKLVLTKIDNELKDLIDKINNNTLLLGHYCIDKITVVSDEKYYYIVYFTDVSDDFARIFKTENEVKRELEEMIHNYQNYHEN